MSQFTTKLKHPLKLNLKCVIFDFDGTIADTTWRTLDIVNQLAPKYGLTQLTLQEAQAHRHLHLSHFLRKIGLKQHMSRSFISDVNKLQAEILPQTKMFPGVKDLILDLKREGLEVGIVTSNLTRNVELFLDTHEFTNQFDFIQSDETLLGKQEVLGRLLSRRRLNRREVLYVGDEVRDINACKAVDISICSVTWGFNNKASLLAEQSDFVVDEPGEILEIARTLKADEG
jgi:phosphoglycolate phosphatase